MTGRRRAESAALADVIGSGCQHLSDSTAGLKSNSPRSGGRLQVGGLGRAWTLELPGLQTSLHYRSDYAYSAPTYLCYTSSQQDLAAALAPGTAREAPPRQHWRSLSDEGFIPRNGLGLRADPSVSDRHSYRS